MKRLAAAAFASTLAALAALPAQAADSCGDQATARKLSGAAKNSFMRKCEEEMAAACEKSAAEKKLAGAAKASFVKKCSTPAQ